jgi:hypothetical protein
MVLLSSPNTLCLAFTFLRQDSSDPFDGYCLPSERDITFAQRCTKDYIDMDFMTRYAIRLS